MRSFVLWMIVLPLLVSTVPGYAGDIKSPGVALTSAKIYVQHQKWDEAYEVIKEGLALDSTHAELQLLMGKVLGEKGEYARANLALQKALAYDRDQMKEIEKLRKRFYNPLMRDGMAAMEEGKLDTARTHLENAAAFWPDRKDAYMQLGVLCHQQEDYACAVDNFQKAHMADPEDTNALRNLALAYTFNDQPDSALAIYRKLLEIQPDDFDTRTAIATLHVTAGDYEKACALYDTLLTEDVDNPNLLYNAGVAYGQTKQYEKAMDAFEQVLEFVPDDVDAMVNLSMMYMQTSEYDKAIPVLQKLTEHNPDNPEFWSSLAVAYVQTENEAEAEEAYERYKQLTGEE